MSANDGAVSIRRERRFARPLLWLVCAGATLGTVVALFSRQFWVAELFSHFRLYYLLAQLVLVMVFLNTRRLAWLALTLVLILPNAWYVGPYLLPMFPRAVTAAPVYEPAQLVSLNLNYRNRDYDRLLEYLRVRAPEVLVLAEYTPEWNEAIGPALAADYPYHMLRPRSDPFGIAVYSRNPFLDARPLELGTPEAENLRIRLLVAGREIELYATHLFPPTSSQRARMRHEQLSRLGRSLAATPYPRLLLGDLNLTPFSPLFTDLLADTGLLDARQAQGLHVTWPSAPLPLWIPIDHCLADPSVGVVDVRIGPDVGSDHYPLEVVIARIN